MCEVELTKANLLQSPSWVMWLGVGGEPYALFFQLLKAKKQRESMNMLLDDNSIIEDKEAILQEVTRFYGALF